MKKETLDLLKTVLQDGKRQLFPYAKDQYALQLLQYFLGEKTQTVGDLRKSAYAKLLDRPLLKNALSNWGDGKINAQRLEMLRSPDSLPFRVTYRQWGAPKHRWNNYDQTSRPGYNLVLQLNFDGAHNKAYQQILTKNNRRRYHPFHYYSHPGEAGKECTLAWARIDVSEDLSVALIEEVQSDWWRGAKSEIYISKRKGRDANGQMREWVEKKSANRLSIDAVETYIEQTLKPYGSIWEEAILAASLEVLWKEIGVEKVFYHDYKSGCLLKNCQPPKSLYSQLPRKFCFQQTEEVPMFLKARVQKTKKLRKADLRFWVLE